MQDFGKWLEKQTPPELAGFGCFLLAVGLGAFGSWQGTITVGGVGAAFLFFARPERYEAVELGLKGLKATTREAERVVGEARATLAQLQMLARVVARTALTLMVSSGRAGEGYGVRQAEDDKESMLRALRALGFTESDVDEIMAPWHAWVTFDYRQWALDGHHLRQDLPRELVHRFWSLSTAPPGATISPNDVEDVLRDTGLLNRAEYHDRLEDYRHYVHTKTHRRPEVWFQRFERHFLGPREA